MTMKNTHLNPIVCHMITIYKITQETYWFKKERKSKGSILRMAKPKNQWSAVINHKYTALYVQATIQNRIVQIRCLILIIGGILFGIDLLRRLDLALLDLMSKVDMHNKNRGVIALNRSRTIIGLNRSKIITVLMQTRTIKELKLRKAITKARKTGEKKMKDQKKRKTKNIRKRVTNVKDHMIHRKTTIWKQQIKRTMKEKEIRRERTRTKRRRIKRINRMIAITTISSPMKRASSCKDRVEWKSSMWNQLTNRNIKKRNTSTRSRRTNMI